MSDLLDQKVTLWQGLVLYALDRADLDLWLATGDPSGCLDIENWLDVAVGTPDALARAGELSDDAAERIEALDGLVVAWHAAKHEHDHGPRDLDLWKQIRSTARPAAVEIFRGLPAETRRSIRPPRCSTLRDGEWVVGHMPDDWAPWLNWS